MASVPPFVLDLLQKLPEPAQEKLQSGMMKAMQDKYHLAMATVPAAYVLCFLPHVGSLSVKLYQKGIKYNNDTPRTEKFEDYPKLLARCAGAHLNALEMFPAFAAAVLLAKIQKANPQRVVALTAKHLKLRLLYTVLYILGVNQLIQLGRTTVWMLLVQNVLELYSESIF